MKTVRFPVFLLALCVPLAGQAQSEDWTALNLDLTDNFIIPAYTELAVETRVLREKSQEYCASPSEEALTSLQASFHDSMDAWQRIQHVKFGPISYFNWQFRLQYWPDEKGTAGRQLDALLAGRDEAVLELDAFARQSVGVQGFPALERLLFSDSALAELQDDYRCAVLQTITANMADIGEGVAQRWVDEFRATVAMEDDSGFFEDEQDASIGFLKALVESLPVLHDSKLGDVLGDSEAAARERRAESWRSGRSLRNIRVNLQAFDDYYHASGNEMSIEHLFLPEDAETVSAAFREALELAGAMADSFAEQLAEPEGYTQLLALQAAIDTLYEDLEAAVKNTDLYLGFNSLDGD